MTAVVGSSVNASGVVIATARAFGTGALDTSNPANDGHTVVKIGGAELTIRDAINMGILRRNSSGVLEELNPPQPYSRVG